jgi:hypothetical protein
MCNSIATINFCVYYKQREVASERESTADSVLLELAEDCVRIQSLVLARFSHGKLA